MPNFASLLIGNKIFKDFSMDWINDLLWGEGIGHSILLLSFVIAAGIQLGKIKVFGISLGITLVLFVGIILGHFGFTVNHNVIHFFKEFGLILFVYSVGMQVGRVSSRLLGRGNHVEYASLWNCLPWRGYGFGIAFRDRYSDAYDGGYFIGAVTNTPD